MLTDGNGSPAPKVNPEKPFPLGPFPRYIWIHDNTPQDGLDKACHEIWKRVQSLPKGLQPTAHADRPGSLQSRGSGQNRDWLLDETKGLESTYRAMIGNREKEMKIRVLCDAQLSSKSTITNLSCSANSHKNSKGLEDDSTTGSVESSKLEMPSLLKRTDTAKGPGNQLMAEETKTVKEFIQKGTFGATKSRAAVPAPTAESQAAGQKQQLSITQICPKPGSSAATKALQNPVITATLDKKKVKYKARTFTPCFSTVTTTTTLNQLVCPSLSLPPPPLFPLYPNFPQIEGTHHQQERIPFQQALHPTFGCYSRQVAPYSTQQIFQLPYTPLWSYIPSVQPRLLYQQRSPPQLPTNGQDPPPAGGGAWYPFPPRYRFSSAPGEAVRTNPSYPSSGNSVNCYANAVLLA